MDHWEVADFIFLNQVPFRSRYRHSGETMSAPRRKTSTREKYPRPLPIRAGNPNNLQQFV